MLKNNFQTLYRAVDDDSHENQPWGKKCSSFRHKVDMENLDKYAKQIFQE